MWDLSCRWPGCAAWHWSTRGSYLMLTHPRPGRHLLPDRPLRLTRAPGNYPDPQAMADRFLTPPAANGDTAVRVIDAPDGSTASTHSITELPPQAVIERQTSWSRTCCVVRRIDRGPRTVVQSIVDRGTNWLPVELFERFNLLCVHGSRCPCHDSRVEPVDGLEMWLRGTA
jgi:hypothetical protein